MSDTPRTDQLDYGMLPDCQPSVIYDCMFRHARILERELNEARQKLAILQDLLNDLEDPLQLIAEYWDKNETLESMTGACWHAVGTAEKALEKIRPHLTYYGS